MLTLASLNTVVTVGDLKEVRRKRTPAFDAVLGTLRGISYREEKE